MDSVARPTPSSGVLALADMPPRTPGYEVVTSREVFRSRWNVVRVDSVRMPDGSVAEREIVQHPNAVGAVPLHDDGTVTLLKQYRHAFGREFLEIPAGKLDVEGEDRAAAMRRELAEEVRLAADDLTELLTFTNSAGWNDEVTTLYVATGLHEVPRPDGFELAAEEAHMEVLRIGLDDALELLWDGGIVDAKTVVGLLAVAQRTDS